MNFEYKAKGKDGQIVAGTMEATNLFVLGRALRDQGLSPISSKPVGGRESAGSRIMNMSFGLGKVSIHDRILFAKNLSGMLEAGLSLYRALSVLEKQSKSKNLQNMFSVLLKTIDQGGSLSDGLAKFPKSFAGLFSAMVKAGEESGNLAKSLMEVSTHLEKTYTLEKKIKGAMMYPAVILCAIGLIGVLMMIFVIPTLAKTFSDLGVALPATTRAVIFISSVISEHTLLFFLSVFAVIFGIISSLRIRKVGIFIDWLFLRLPGVSLMAKETNIARTCHTIGSLLAAGVSMSKTLSITEEVLQNYYYKKALSYARPEIEKGVALSDFFKKYPHLFSEMSEEMSSVGEETGNLSEMLLSVADFYEKDLDERTKNLSSIIEPVLMIFVGAAVGFFALSIISPLYSILDSIK